MAAYFTLYSQNDEYVRFRLYLSDSFNQDYYNSAGITRYKFTSTSGASSISGIVGEENAPSSGRSSRVSVDVYYDDLPADPGDTITLYAYAEDTSGRYWAIENEDGDFGIEIEIPKPVEPSIYSFDTSSVDVGQREITFDYDIRDWNSNVYGVLLIRTTEESTAGEYNVGYLDSSGSFSYTTSRYDSFYASLRITDGRGGDYIAEESCDTRPIDVIPSFSNFRYGSYSGEKSAYFRWNMDDITSDCYYLVYSRLQGESSYGSERLDYSATSHTFYFQRTGTIEAHIVLYHPNSGGEIARYPSSGDVLLESSAPNPTVSGFRATSHQGQMSATFYWSTSDIQSGNYLRLWIKHSSDSGYGYKDISASSTSYEYTFTRTGTYYAHIVLYDSSGKELSRSPSSGDISVQSTYSITGFDWTSSELNAFNNNGDIKTLTRERWNSFLDYVDRCVDYYNAKNGTSYSKLSSSVRMGTDRIMYASSFKAVCQKINDITQATMSGITLSQIVKGNPIKGSYFPYMLQFLKDRM